ncbi:hypothetical protein V1498_15765 [Peribacillus sp. SCS-26]|uniref:hypothetical protein n=1 Tax=Paraperibacillus marinus TaxID=3115295 RepID=UPI0039064A70
MKGLFFINDRMPLECCTSLHESKSRQISASLSFIREHNLEILRLNPFQVNDFYTIPHAMLFDLNLTNEKPDFLLVYSPKTLHKFQHVFPEEWEKLQSRIPAVIPTSGYEFPMSK